MTEQAYHARPAATVPPDIVNHAGRAGFLAALVMLAVQLIWRLNWSKDGVVQAFPEFIVAAISRLTPLSVFGAATENYGSLAKKTLFTAVLLGVVAVGFRSGAVAGSVSRRIGYGGLGRLAAGLLVAAALLLVTLIVVMPIAHLGLFASDSSYTSDILIQLTTTFALFGVLWAIFASPRLSESDIESFDGELVSRRSVIGQAAWGLGTLAAVVAVFASTWRLVSPRKVRSNPAVAQQTTNEIVATAQAEAAQKEATAEAQAALQETNAQELFARLDAEGKITPILTATDDFYHVSKNLSDPTVSSDGWTLKITGMVHTPLELTYDEVVARATEQKITTLSCISNELNGDLTGTAQWTGFSLKTLLDEAGVQEGAVDLKFKAADDYEDSIPLDRGLDADTIVVTGMNGEPLRDDHGFPARMIVPGIYGMKNIKWLNEVEVVGEDFMGYWQTRGWSDTAVNQIWGRIDEPNGTQDPGLLIATGLASAGDRDIARVEVSLDDGDTWADAILEPSLNPPFTWVRWAYQFTGEPGKTYRLKMRATDGTGQVMSEESRPPLPDGATGWPRRQVKTKG